MTDTVRIRPARHPELPALTRLIRNRLPDLMGSQRNLSGSDVESHLATLLPDGALILATRNNRLAGLAALDLDKTRLLALYLDPERARADTARELIAAVERQALAFGVDTLHCIAKAQACAFLQRLGYRNGAGDSQTEAPEDAVPMEKSLTDGASPVFGTIMGLLDELGIPRDYGIKHRLKIVPEAEDVVSVGSDVFGRDQRLRPQAGEAWEEMRTAAMRQNVELQMVSGYRSISYQGNLIRKKLHDGSTIEDIMSISAAPGFSEHHSGQAIDINTPGVTALSNSFAASRAYQWLRSNAGLYGFRESYPKNNRHGLEWEPWHWYFRHRPGTQPD